MFERFNHITFSCYEYHSYHSHLYYKKIILECICKNLTRAPRVRITGTIPFLPATPVKVCEILSLPQDDLRKQFLHPKVESSKRIKQYDSQTSLKYQRNVKAWGSTARDMCVLIHVRKLKNDDIALVVSSMKTTRSV